MAADSRFFPRFAAKQRGEFVQGGYDQDENMDEELQTNEYYNDAIFPTTEDIVEEAVQQHLRMFYLNQKQVINKKMH